ncbi:uncharacterized protein LOC106663350 [Cimex lectularius]|uniref:RING-type domain-containing protein n=1 Tax=Cimex lectularius TaxID=79782 RepID=A0A8I6RGU6_CIMLE|nr:uncharacterized protein LOC106663350 [Cimex lectularius]
MSQENSKYVILNHDQLTDIQIPIRSTHRIKYTCFAVSQKYLVFGATSGGVYVFRRSPCQFIHLIATKEGPIGKLTISKDERFIAISSLQGAACILEWDEEEDKSKIINRSFEHNGSSITEMVWAETNQLYIGDSMGRLSVINISLCVSKNIFLLPSFVFMQLDSGIVQISCFENYLLISTEKWCYVCDTAKEHYKQIGSKPREGVYGACFYTSSNDIKIYSARPGSRLWEVNLSGTVLSTHQLKKVLAIQPTPIISLRENRIIVQIQQSWPDQPFNFCYLLNFLDRFLLTFKNDGIYIIDPIAVKVVVWTNIYCNISSVKCISNTIYIWTSSGNLHCIDAMQVNQCLIELYFKENFPLCMDLCEMYLDDFVQPEDFHQLTPLAGLKDFIPHEKKELINFVNKLEKHNSNIQSSTKLDSGIFLVENRHWKKWKVNENRNALKLNKIPYYNKTRSLPHDILGSGQRSNSYRLQQTLSLPDFHLIVEPLNSNSTALDALFENSSKSGIIPKIPFLSIASPEIFHSTISELHQNVSGKLLSGTKTLRSKWQYLEGKFKFLMLNSSPINSEQCNSIKWKEPPISCNNLNGTCDNDDGDDDDIIPSSEKSKLSKSDIDVSEIKEAFNSISKTEEPKKDLVFKLFDSILYCYNMICAQESKRTASKGKSVFPFNTILPTECNDLIKHLLHNYIKNGKMFSYIENINESLIGNFDFPEHPQLLTEVYTAYQLKLDCYLRNILFVFSELIDPFVILYNLETSKVPCVFHSWSIILDTFQESALNYITTDNSNGFEYKSWPLPLLLNTIFLMFRLQQIDSSYYMSTESSLKFYHISFLILKLSLYFESTGMTKEEREKICNELLLKYVTKMLENQCFKIDYLFDFTVAYHLESAFLKFNYPFFPICACGHPICEKIETDSTFSTIGKLLLYMQLINYKTPNHRILHNEYPVFISSSDSEDIVIQRLVRTHIKDKNIIPNESLKLENLKPTHEDIDEFSYNNKFGRLMKMLQALPELFSVVMKCVVNNINDVIPFIVQYAALDDLNYLAVPMDEKMWILLCDSTVKFSKGMCCICSTPFSHHIEMDWNTIAITMLKSLFASKTISLLKNYSMDIGAEALDVRFYRACILSSALGSGGYKNHASIINNYYYDVSTSLAKEVSEDTDLLLFEDTPQCTPSVIQTKYSNTWGIQVDINVDVCGRCALVLNSKNLAQNGLRAFKCGHVYHTICLHLACSNFNCPICASR